MGYPEAFETRQWPLHSYEFHLVEVESVFAFPPPS